MLSNLWRVRLNARRSKWVLRSAQRRSPLCNCVRKLSRLQERLGQILRSSLTWLVAWVSARNSGMATSKLPIAINWGRQVCLSKCCVSSQAAYGCLKRPVTANLLSTAMECLVALILPHERSNCIPRRC